MNVRRGVGYIPYLITSQTAAKSLGLSSPEDLEKHQPANKPWKEFPRPPVTGASSLRKAHTRDIPDPGTRHRQIQNAEKEQNV